MGDMGMGTELATVEWGARAASRALSGVALELDHEGPEPEDMVERRAVAHAEASL